MTPARLQTIEEIFHAALDREPEQVGTFLNTACGGDEPLCRRVEALLASHERAGSFIETPAAGIAARIIENGQADVLVGQTVGHYKILERIGSGGMGEVYLACDITAGRKAALKLLPMRFTSDAERLRRFQQEARTVVGLNHPNILTVYEIGQYDSSHYIASELIEGETLRERLARGRMGLDESIDVAIQMATALAAAHQAGIVHRDVKPENIMLRPDGYVKVLDFGIAKLAEQEVPVTMAEEEALLLVETNLGSILGTVRYMSPEQARGAPVDQCSDIWSLGVVLYEMVAGRAPFTGETPREVMASVLGTEPPPLTTFLAHTSAELQQIVSKALCKEREERYQSAREVLAVLKSLRRGMEFKAELERSTTARPWLRWTRSPTAAALLVLVIALALALPFYWHRNPTRSSVPEKSIAVLPFENLSDDKENSYFVAGFQEEILSDLAKIADLKVISRTSANVYKSGSPRNAREIGQQLGVAHLLEASVQRAGKRVRVNAQLVDTRSDAHLWAQSYVRDLADVFAIQNEIAQLVTAQLQAKISPREREAMSQAPTTDLVAMKLYAEARDLHMTGGNDRNGKRNLLEAARLLEEAVARDPHFLLAYCLLAETHLEIYWEGFDAAPARRDLASAAIENAVRLQPDAGEVHLAKAAYAYHGFRDYDRARAELERARGALPNNVEIYDLTALIDRRQGRWTEATRNLARAVELDPLNFGLLFDEATTAGALRRYAEATSLLERALKILPRDHAMRTELALISLHERGDTLPLHALLSNILSEEPDVGQGIAYGLFYCALAERDSAAMTRALALMPREGMQDASTVLAPHEWYAGLAARMSGDLSVAQASFTASRAPVETMLGEQPDYAAAWSLLGLIDAGLARKDDALREGRRACELLPVSRDAIIGPALITNLALIYAWTGEKDLAFEQLTKSAQIPSGVTYGDLKLNPKWDSLRHDPRFEKLLAKTGPSSNPQTPVAPEKSIAVLPFKPLLPEDRDASLEMGMADTIIARLSNIREIVVRPLSAVRRYVDLEQEPLIAGRELGVESVLEGSIQKRGDKIRMTVRLMNVANGGSLWAGTFDEEFTDIFSVQDAIAERVVAALALRLSSAEKQRLTKRDTQNTEAYQLYLRGRYFWWKTTPEEFRKSRDYFQRAVDADPSYALGYCGLNSYYGFGAAWGMLPPDEAWPRAEKAVAKALELDDTLAEVHNDLGALKMVFHRDWAGAEREIRRALELNPTFEEAHYLYSFYLVAMGRFDEASAEAKRALELDPLSVRITQHLGATFYYARRYDEAITQYRQALELDPNNASVHESLGDAFERKELPGEAVAEWQRGMTLAGDDELARHLGSAYAKAGFAGAMCAVTQKKLERLNERREKGGYVPAIDYARAYVRLGDKEQAFQWLSKACEERNVFALLLKSDPFYNSLREDPRFSAILKRIGLR